MMNKTARLENWSIVAANELTVYEAPELQRYKLQGDVYGHPGFEDGEFITTSTIMSEDVKKYGTVETRNTSYELGTPSDHYLIWCKKNGVKKLAFGAFAL